MSMTLSSSSSLSSSPSITPRSIRSMITMNNPTFEYPLIMNRNEDSNRSDKHKNSILNQYLPSVNRLQNNQ